MDPTHITTKNIAEKSWSPTLTEISNRAKSLVIGTSKIATGLSQYVSQDTTDRSAIFFGPKIMQKWSTYSKSKIRARDWSRELTSWEGRLRSACEGKRDASHKATDNPKLNKPATMHCFNACTKWIKSPSLQSVCCAPASRVDLSGSFCCSLSLPLESLSLPLSKTQEHLSRCTHAVVETMSSGVVAAACGKMIKLVPVLIRFHHIQLPWPNCGSGIYIRILFSR